MAYPSNTDVFSTKVDGVDEYLASHVNAVQSAIVAVETELGTGLKGALATLSARLAVAMNTDGTVNSAQLSGSVPAAKLGTGTPDATTFLRGDGTWNLPSGGSPGLHHTTHQNGGSDAVSLDAVQVATGTLATGRLGSGTPTASKFLRGDQTWNQVDYANLTGVPAASTSTAGVVQLETDGGTTAGRAVDGSDSRLKRGASLTLCAALTPTGTGADAAELVVPFDPKDGTTSITWNVRRLDFRVQTAGGAPAITVEKSTGSGVFSATSVGTVTLGSGAYEGNNTSSLGTVASGDKLRFNVGTLATALNWTVQVELGQ